MAATEQSKVAPPAERPAGDGSPSGNGAGAPPTEPPQKTRSVYTRPVLFAVVAIIFVLAVVYGVRYFRWASTHVSTDDAYLTSDIIQIAPQVSGTVTDVRVNENQIVKKGDLLVVLDDATYRANTEQAQANLDATIAQAKGAGVTVAVTQQTSSAGVTQAQAGIEQAQGGVATAQSDVARAAATVASSSAAVGAAQANVANAEAGVQSAIAGKQRAADAVISAQAVLDTARAGVRAAQAGVDAAQAAATKAIKDQQRYADLARQGAISEQTVDQAAAAAQTATAQLEAARQQLAQANAVVAQHQADLNAAKQQVGMAGSAISQARAGLRAAQQQANAAKATVRQSQAAQAAAQQSVRVAQARKQQAQGQLVAAETAPRQVAVSKTAQAQANAKIEQARAALDAAKLQLGYTRIYAPVDGRVSKKSVEVGNLVQPGTPLMAMVPPNDIWVQANFKETQLTGVHAGSPAEVEVDALPGHVFRAHVDSISAATGATFALLPPDNATGNFTKVVQRVPVKIVFEADQPALDRLGAGMSVTATVTTR